MFKTPGGASWRQPQIALVAGALIAMGFALYQTHRCSGIYEQIILANARYFEVTRALGEILKRARQANAPANDVFDSHDVVAERGRFRAAADALNEHLSSLHTLPADAAASLRASARAVRATSETLFEALERNDVKKAGALMAKVDRTHADLVRRVEDLRDAQFEAQQDGVGAYEVAILSVRSSEISFAIFGLLAALSAFLYARRRRLLDHAHRSSDVQNQQVLSAMSSSLVMAVMNKDGRIIEANDNLCRVSGYDRAELIGLDHRVFSANGHAPKFFDDLWAKISIGETWTGDVANRRKDGKLYHLRVVITPILDLNGNIDRYLKVCYDVTDQKRTDDWFLEAQAIAKIGSWRNDFVNNEQTWSPETYRMFELSEAHSPAELTATFRDRIHPEDRPKFEAAIARSIETGVGFTVDFRLYLDGGQRIKYLRSVSKPITDHEGRTIGLWGTCQDLTEFILLQAQNKFILDSMGIGIWRFNPVTQDLVWDESLYGVYELNAADFNGHYEAWRSSLTAEASENAVRELQSALRGDTEFNTTFEIMTKSGQRKHIGGRGVVIRDKANQPIMMYGINWDRTREVLMEASLQQERAKSLHHAKLASLGEMSAGIAHEINNPLAVIVGSVPLVRKYQNDEVKFSAKLDLITRSAGRIEKIVKGLKKFSRSSEGTIRGTERLADIVNETLIITEAKAKRHGTPVTIDVPDDLFIDCDAVEIEQVLVNLINNGIDAVKTDPERWVRVTASADDDQVVMRILDSGPGISIEIEKKLTQPFFTTKAVGEGTGLGLSITKGILDSHGATLGLNRSFANTCFEIRFKRVPGVTKGASDAA